VLRADAGDAGGAVGLGGAARLVSRPGDHGDNHAAIAGIPRVIAFEHVLAEVRFHVRLPSFHWLYFIIFTIVEDLSTPVTLNR
jgi:hypothetical protein